MIKAIILDLDGTVGYTMPELQKAMNTREAIEDVKKIVKHNGAELQSKMQENADFTKGYATGATKQSIGLEIKDDGFTAEVGPTKEYAPYLEYGTRFMDAQPFAKPAYIEQKEKFEKDMQKLAR